MKKINYIVAIMLGILIGMVIEQRHMINSLESVNESAVVYEEATGTFWCHDCEAYYDEYCEGCGKDEELWDMYCDEYVMMNYCEDCDQCCYKYCDCTKTYDYEDYETFINDYEYYQSIICEQ